MIRNRAQHHGEPVGMPADQGSIGGAARCVFAAQHLRRHDAQYAGGLFEQSVLVLTHAPFHALWQTSGMQAREL